MQNPYSPPNDNDEFESTPMRRETLHPFNRQNLSGLNGRMGRLDFAILIATVFFIILLIQKMLGINPFLVGASAMTENEIISKQALNTGVMLGVFGLFIYTFLAVKRLHDLNYSGAVALVFIVPLLPLGLLSVLFAFVGLILRLILLFAKGEPVKNRFGDVPDGNHRKKLLLLITLILAICLLYSNLYTEARPTIEPIFQELLEQMEQQQ